MEETKKKIINSAKELFSNYGYKKVSMDEIAIKAKITKKTIYSYFKDKESLLKYIVDLEIKEIMNTVDNYSLDSNLDFFEFINNTLKYLLDYRKNSKLLITISKDAKENNEISKSSIIKFDESIINFIKEKLEIFLNKNNKINKKIDLDLCSFIIYKIYIAVMFEYPKEIDEKEVTNNITEVLKTGLFN